MLTSKAFLLGTTVFALFSFYALFYSLYQTQLKFPDTTELNFLSQDKSPWFQRKTKVVFVIVDGLRFDFLLNFDNIEHMKELGANKFHQFNKAYFKEPEKYVVFKAFADLPTMTVLRVPCMMTGNVPRLGSVLTAFGALPATEDSIPRQLFLQGKKSYFAGDPILPQYFPKYLTSDFTIGAFNVRDRFVDDPSHSYMNEKLKDNDFDFLGGHFLEVDHAGHHSGIATELMSQSIDNLDAYLMEIISRIDDDTMLLFAGDHGLTLEGSHGGGTLDETETAIVAYYKKGFMKNKYKNLEKIMRSVNETTEDVNQIDIVPTLSMLMGLPSPFSNMGQILNDLYPVGDYLPDQKDCPEVSFLLQLLHDNRLNTLQVWNYFRKYHEGQSLFSQQEFSPAAKLFENVEADYKAADQMIQENRQCEQAFHDIAVSAIQKSQQLAKVVHDMVSLKPPHDLIIFWQAFLLLVLAAISYVLQIQYLYKTKDYEYTTWSSPKTWDWISIAKSLVPLTIPLTLVWIYMMSQGYIIMRPITSTGFALGVWVFGNSIKSVLSKPQGHVPQVDESYQSPTTCDESEANTPSSFDLKSFVLFQNPLVFAGTLAIFGYLLYLTQGPGVDPGLLQKLTPNIPGICVILIAFRIAGKYQKFAPHIIGGSVVIAVILKVSGLHNKWSLENNLRMPLVFLGDWLWCEMKFAQDKLKTSKVWSYHYIAGFIVLVFYHHILSSGSDFTQIYLPRVLWAILVGSILAGYALKLPSQAIKRNWQVNIVLFLCLMQVHKKFIYFGFVLCIMRILTYVFKRTSFKNYLYPLSLGLLSYLGLWAIGYDDLKLPRRFGPAFVGLRDFHLGSCLILFSSSFLSTIILSAIFMSFYSQDLEGEDVQLGAQEEQSSVKIVALKGHSTVIRKRNLIFFCFFYNVLFIVAAINPIRLKNPFDIFTAMETFLVDGSFYLFTINMLYFMF